MACLAALRCGLCEAREGLTEEVLSLEVVEMGWGQVKSQRASEDRGQLDLDVRRPLSKRGTLEATARQQSTSSRSPVPL